MITIGDVYSTFFIPASARWLEAEAGLAYLYGHGKGMRRDYRKAFGYYTAAAKKGNLTATNNLADMYDKGHGVRRDLRQAMEWYCGSRFCL
jgi:uncharacterized protein